MVDNHCSIDYRRIVGFIFDRIGFILVVFNLGEFDGNFRFYRIRSGEWDSGSRGIREERLDSRGDMVSGKIRDICREILKSNGENK